MSVPVFRENLEKYLQFVVCWISLESGKDYTSEAVFPVMYSMFAYLHISKATYFVCMSSLVWILILLNDTSPNNMEKLASFLIVGYS